MSNEAGLSDQERRILASLAAKASADDPVLAAALRGQGRRAPQLPGVLRHWISGVVITAVGLALAVLSLPVSVILGEVAVLVMVGGAYLAVSARAAEHRPVEGTVDAPSPGDRAGS